MTSAKTVTVEFGGATVQIPEKIVVQNWLQGLTAAPANAVVTLNPQPPRIGAHWPEQGGIYAGLIRGENGHPDYHVIVAPGDDGETTEITWGEAGVEIEDATHEWAGDANTDALILSPHDHPAAEWANGLALNGKNDWYLPARRELALCFANVPELFAKRWHWSSTQCSADSAFIQVFDGGGQLTGRKSLTGRARAVRRFISHLPL